MEAEINMISEFDAAARDVPLSVPQAIMQPIAPSTEEMKLHALTHCPHVAWCDICIKARGRDDAHRAGPDEGPGLLVDEALALVEIDYSQFSPWEVFGI